MHFRYNLLYVYRSCQYVVTVTCMCITPQTPYDRLAYAMSVNAISHSYSEGQLHRTRGLAAATTNVICPALKPIWLRRLQGTSFNSTLKPLQTSLCGSAIHRQTQHCKQGTELQDVIMCAAEDVGMAL